MNQPGFKGDPDAHHFWEDRAGNLFDIATLPVNPFKVLGPLGKSASRALQRAAGLLDRLKAGAERALERGREGVSACNERCRRKGGARKVRSSGVRVVESAEELQSLFQRLSAGGKVVEETSYAGRLVELGDKTTVGLRAGSKSGGPTIDIKLPGGNLWKVHVQ